MLPEAAPVDPRHCPEVDIICMYGAKAWLLPLDTEQLRLVLMAMLAQLRSSGIEIGPLCLRIVNDAEIARLNAKFLHCQGPTNIISFPSESGAGAELALSLDTFARECLLYGQPGIEHLLRLLAHGASHLAGYDHGSEMDAVTSICMEKASAALFP